MIEPGICTCCGRDAEVLVARSTNGQEFYAHPRCFSCRLYCTWGRSDEGTRQPKHIGRKELVWQ